LKQSQRIDPASFSTYETLGFVYANLKSYKGAMEKFKKALEINSNDAKTHIFIAIAYDNIN
jgi:tetratricopeptide (TPR) repeat protein|tara:strand:- start:615 stop:797 length:183 start_codon:yes stop_codon:yes gene_type:complete